MKHFRKTNYQGVKLLLALLVGGWLSTFGAFAAVLNWANVTWTAGLSNSYNTSATDGVTDGSYDLKVSMSGPASNFTSGTGPAINNTQDGGLGGSVLLMDVTYPANTTTTLVTIQFFNAGATGVSFTLTDIDFRNSGGQNYRDYVSNIKAMGQSGTYNIAPTLTKPTGSTDVITNNGATNAGAYGTTSVDSSLNDGTENDGNLTINFGTNLIYAIQFTYGNLGVSGTPTEQWVGIGNITFTPRVPEVHSALAASLFCLIPVVVRWGRRRRD